MTFRRESRREEQSGGERQNNQDGKSMSGNNEVCIVANGIEHAQRDDAVVLPANEFAIANAAERTELGREQTGSKAAEMSQTAI